MMLAHVEAERNIKSAMAPEEEKKKDLTGIIDLTKASQASISHQAGEDVQAPIEQAPIETVDSFESFDQFQKSGLTENPAPPETSSTDFPTTEPSVDSSNDFPPAPEFAAPGPEVTAPVEVSTPVFTSAPETSTQLGTSSKVITENQIYPNPPVSFGDTSPQLTPQAQGMDQVKSYSESVSASARSQQSFVWSLNGYLTNLEKAKLKEIVIKENLGLTAEEIDLQLKAGRVRLPRISEYVGVHLIQTFRDAKADMKLLPVQDEDQTMLAAESKSSIHLMDEAQLLGAAAHIPLTSGEILPEFRDWEIVDTLTASIGLTSHAVEIEKTDTYSQAIDALKKEMRLRAFHKGASAIILFSIQMIRLSLPTHYKVFAVGTAIRRIGTG